MKMYKTIDPTTKKFVYGYPLLYEGEVYFASSRELRWVIEKINSKEKPGSHFVHVSPWQICELTGARDRNNKLIWENDLISITAPGKTFDRLIGVVIYDDTFACWCICWDFEYETAKAFITLQDCQSDDKIKLEVIGNIKQKGFRSPQEWYDYLCLQEYELRTGKAKTPDNDDLPF